MRHKDILLNKFDQIFINDYFRFTDDLQNTAILIQGRVLKL